MRTAVFLSCLCLPTLVFPAALRAQEDSTDAAEVVEVGQEEEGAGEEAEGEEGGEVAATVDSPSLIDQAREEARRRAALVTPPLLKYPSIEWHGSFRFRADLFGEADLGTYAAASETEYVATSLFLPPLVKNYTNASGNSTFSDEVAGAGEKTVGTANLRLRLSPEISVSDALRIGTTVDLLDNLVAGSTPEYLGNVSASGSAGGTGYYGGYPGPSVPLDTFTNTQVPPAAGINALQDSVSVKEAWAEWIVAFDEDLRPDSFNLGTVRVGRYAWDWGLGILSSRGDYDRNDTALTPLERYRALDAEWGSYLDRISWRYNFSGVRLLAGWGWLSSGPTSRVATGAGGQTWDLEQKDDIWQAEVALYSRPETRQDFIDRRKALFSGRPLVDWGLYVTCRGQDMSSRVKEGSTSTWADYTADYGSIELVDRNAWLVTPDLWLRLDWRPDPLTRYYAAVEAVMAFGSVANTTGTADPDKVDVLQYGVALETNVTLNLVSFGLDAGMASGDTAEMMAFYTGRTRTPWGTDGKYNAFSFNRNYILDMLLFREVVGTVTNSAYLRGHFDFDVIPTEDSAFGGLLTALYGMTLEPEAWPGDSRNLGLEFGAHLFYEETGRFLGTAGFGLLFPFGALDRPKDFLGSNLPADGAEWAWTLQGNLFLVF